MNLHESCKTFENCQTLRLLISVFASIINRSQACVKWDNILQGLSPVHLLLYMNVL